MLTLDRCFLLAPPLLNQACRRSRRIRMASTSSEPSTHSITLPCQVSQPVEVIASSGVSDSLFRSALDSSLLKQWLRNLQSENGILASNSFLLKRINIQAVDMFGKRVGFLKFKADIFDTKCGRKVPGIVFARGPAVAALVLLDSDDQTYAVLTEQVRVPSGRYVLELPAGMVDDARGDIVGTAVREVEEETGIRLNIEDMVDLTSFLDASTGRKIFTSPGGSDEEVSLFLYKGFMSSERISQLQGKEAGLQEHGELIKVHVVPYNKLWRMTSDVKVLMAIGVYEMAKKEGLCL